MDISEIPVLTKVVHKTATQTADIDELVIQLKQALLPEIAQLIATQLADKHADSLTAGQQSLADHAHVLKQDLLVQAQSQMGESIQAVEEAFTEAMGNVSKQHLQSFMTSLESNVQSQLQTVEERLSQLNEVQQQSQASVEQSIRETVEKSGAQWVSDSLSPLMETQQAQLEGRIQALREQLEQSLDTHAQQLQESGKQTLATSQETAISGLIADYKESLQQAFSELNTVQMTEFRQNMQAELSSSEAVLQEKVVAIVATQLQEMEAEMNKRLKSRILEVLQGIKFVMPTI